MPALNEEQRKFYQDALDRTRRDIDELDVQIEAELAKVKDRIAELQSAKEAAKQMYAAACARLGIPNDMEAGEG
jgi:hypothetical protein